MVGALMVICASRHSTAGYPGQGHLHAQRGARGLNSKEGLIGCLGFFFPPPNVGDASVVVVDPVPRTDARKQTQQTQQTPAPASSSSSHTPERQRQLHRQHLPFLPYHSGPAQLPPLHRLSLLLALLSSSVLATAVAFLLPLYFLFRYSYYAPRFWLLFILLRLAF
jgi:hypothetical protein